MTKETAGSRASLLQILSAAVGTALWYCCDDTLAAHLGNDGIGNLPFWCVFIVISIFEGYSPDLGQWRQN